MSNDITNLRRPTFRRRAVATAIIVALALVGKVIHWSVINAVPVGRIDPPVAMPTPNGYDYYVRAEWVIDSHPRSTVFVNDENDDEDRNYPQPSVANLQAAVASDRETLTLVDEGLRYPVAGPAPRYVLDRAHVNGYSDSPEARLLNLLEDDAVLSAMRHHWPAAAAKWLRTMAFADSFPDLGPRYDWSLLKNRSRNGAGRAMWSIIPHLNRAQTAATIDGIVRERATWLPELTTLRIEKHATEQALLVMFRNRNWRHEWGSPAWMPYPDEYPSGVKTALLALKSDKTYLREYDAAANKEIARKATEKDIDSADLLLRDIWPMGDIVGDQAYLDCALVEAALHEYHLDHGVYPATLGNLVPAYLSVLPRLPFTNEHYAYTTIQKAGVVTGCKLASTMTYKEWSPKTPDTRTDVCTSP